VRLHAAAFCCGLAFAVGLGLSGMTRADRVVGFLDVFGRWDPSLALVMGGALAVMVAANRLTRRLGKPVYAASFPLAPPRRIDARLVGGAALFGVGWGLGGYCPGPGLVSIGAVTLPAIVFVTAMALGMVVHNLLMVPRPAPTVAAPDALPGPVTVDR
jgi:hypothetical protein